MRLSQPQHRPGTRGDFRVLHELRLGAARHETCYSMLIGQGTLPYALGKNVGERD